MAVTGSKFGYFVVWINNDLIFEKVQFDEAHWNKVEQNLSIFFKAYVCPVLLQMKQLYFCGVCEEVLLNNNEIETKEEEKYNSVQCDQCLLWFHIKCVGISVIEAENLQEEWLCKLCLLSLQDQN